MAEITEIGIHYKNDNLDVITTTRNHKKSNISKMTKLIMKSSVQYP